MHSAELLHRDMKPSNLLLNSDCLMKVADFGLARSLTQERIRLAEGDADSKLTDYVATRWYRAPEILLGASSYSFAVDMWATGCILGEMIHGRPIFPGTSTIDQLEKIARVCGCPSQQECDAISPFANSIRSQLHSGETPHSGARNVRGTDDPSAEADRPSAEADRNHFRRFQQHFPSSASEDGIDLLVHLLHFMPKKRLTADEALDHPYVGQFHDPAVERKASAPVRPTMDDNTKLNIRSYRDAIYKDISALFQTDSKKGQQSYRMDSQR